MPIGGVNDTFTITGAKLKVTGGVQVSGSIAYTDDATGFGGVAAQIDTNNTLNITAGKTSGVAKIERSTAASITAVDHTNVSNNTTIHIALKNTSTSKGDFITLGLFANDDTVKVNYTDEYVISPGETGMITARKVAGVLSMFVREMFSSTATDFDTANTPFYIKDGVDYKYPLYKTTGTGLVTETIGGVQYYRPSSGIKTKTRPPLGIPELIVSPSGNLAIGNSPDLTTVNYDVWGVPSNFSVGSIYQGTTKKATFILENGEASGSFTESGASSGDAYSLYVEGNDTLSSDTVSSTLSQSDVIVAFHHDTFTNSGNVYTNDTDINTALTNNRFYSDTPYYTSSDLGTIENIPNVLTQYPNGSYLGSGNQGQGVSINNNGFITSYFNRYNGFNNSNYRILDNDDTTNAGAVSDQGCSFSYYNQYQPVYISNVYVDFNTSQPEDEYIMIKKYENNNSYYTSYIIKSRNPTIFKTVNNRNIWEIPINGIFSKIVIDCYTISAMGGSFYSMYWKAYIPNSTTYTWTPPNGITDATVLMVAGGGGGGGHMAGGGGAGGVVYNVQQSLTGQKTIIVGGGGSGGLAYSSGGLEKGKNGSDTSFTGLTTAVGGGGGGSYASNNASDKNGGSGGSGGGGGHTASAGTGTSSQGYDGGSSPNNNVGGGGGGGGSVGSDGTTSNGGDGGDGVDYSSVFGTMYGDSGWFASGGGGGARDGTSVAGTASNGGGTSGFHTSDNQAENAQHHTGGGGGGGGSGTGYDNNNRAGGNGGSGIVLVKFTGNVTTGKTIPKVTGATFDSTNVTFTVQGSSDITNIKYTINGGSEQTTPVGTLAVAHGLSATSITVVAYAVDANGVQISTKKTVTGTIP